MGTYAVTGAASGMGLAVTERLRARGDRVIGVDLRDVDVVADLSTSQGRAEAARRMLELAGGSLDGAVMAAGLGGIAGRDEKVLQVNYFGVVELLEAWRPALAEHGRAKVVVIGSNSTTLTPLVPRWVVSALLDGDGGRALAGLRPFGGQSSPFAYAASKIAVTRWARRTATLPGWAGAGIRLNVLAPGIVSTPLLDEQLAAGQKDAVEGLALPVGERGTPDLIARWVEFMLSDAADYVCGSVLFVDGGSDAWFRPDAWPRSTGPLGVLTYLRRAKGWRASASAYLPGAGERVSGADRSRR